MKFFIAHFITIYTLLICCCFPESGYGQQMGFRYLGIESGLSNNSVTCMLQDQYGFIWMGTYDGLNRYDGYEFKIFVNELNNPNSLCNNHVKSIAEAGKRIFVGTEKGLMYLDNSDLKLHHLYYENGKNQVEKISFIISRVITDRSGIVYVATQSHGVLRFSSTDTVGHAIPVSNSTLQYQASAMTIDHKGLLWIYLNGRGLGYYDTTKKEIRIAEPLTMPATCLTVDPENQVWIGTGTGVYIYNSRTRLLKPFDQNDRLQAASISSITCTSSGDVWIGNDGPGLNIWSHSTRRLSYLSEGTASGDLHSGAVIDAFEDKEKRIWICTLRGGVNIKDNHSSPFTNFTHQPGNVHDLPNNFIRSFCEDKIHNVWVGTDGAGLSYWERSSGKFITYRQSAKSGPRSNLIVGLSDDFKGTLWVASFNGGIDALDPKTHAFKHYVLIKPGTDAEEKHVWYVYQDAQLRLWVGTTWGGTLYLLNRQANKFEVFDSSLTDIHTLYQDNSGRFWGGDYTHLILIDPVSKKHRFFYTGFAVRAIKQDNKGQLWIGTEGGGLLRFDPTTHVFERFSTTDGLSNNSVLNILVDPQNRLWCSTYRGLSCFDQTTKAFTKYFASDGLQSNQFLYGAAIKLSSGEFLFGSIKGFSMFDPAHVKPYVHMPDVRLTDFKINNISVNDEPSYAHQQPLNSLKTIEIPFNQASIAVSYTALEYTFPEKITYAYYLEGWDPAWNYVKNLKTAYYSRLNAGRYKLKIKVTNTVGQWSEPIVIDLVVLPPWYRTWWAYLSYIALFSLIIYRIWLYRIRQAKLKYEVAIANLEIEKEKEANEKKLSFFTNVSHEFRTPLTLIINPVKDLLKQKAYGKNEEINLVYRNATRLLGLVDQLLMFRKSENENSELKLSLQNLSELSLEIFNCFIHQAKIKQINYTFNAVDLDIPIYVDREKIEIALFNLISNALKFTSRNGSILVSVRQDECNAFFEITDTGIGISTDVGEKLFDKYYQAKDARSLKTGFGIGLYLVKTFISAHHGTINYQSDPGKGTTFILGLLKGKSHLNGHKFIEYTPTTSAYIEELADLDRAESESSEAVINNLELLISNQQSILIIDDDPQLRSYVRSIFDEEYKVYEAGDGSEGVEMVKKILPDVVICDIVMPNLDGLELCRIIKKDSQLSHIPIIFLTGEQGSDIAVQGIEEGAVDFLSKPFNKDLLVARVKGIIRNKKELQNYFMNEITLKNDNSQISEENKQFLYRCIEVIENSLLDPVLDVNILAEKMGMSYSNIYKRIKSITGQSMNSFIRFVRVRKSAEILIETNCNVNEAAFRVGFSDVKYYREQFYKQFGVNPSDFIKKHRVAFQKKGR